MKIINPHFAPQVDNVFEIRSNEYNLLKEQIGQVLEPVKDIGFEILEFDITNPVVKNGELLKTLRNILVIKLQRGKDVVNLSMQIPRLVENNYIQIHGKKKVPVFQLFDIPIVTRGHTIKISTNVATMVVEEKKESPHIILSVLGKQIPFHLIMFAHYGFEELNKIFEFEKFKPVAEPTMVEKLIHDMKFYYETADHDVLSVIKEIGKFYTPYDFKVKGENLLYALSIMLKIDIFSRKFFESDSMVDEIFKAIEKRHVDDTDFINKRIRCFEYVIISTVAKTIFDMCLATRSTKSAKFKTSSSQIMKDCNVSDIIKYDFSINPIDELTLLTRTSLVGPGGFKKENVPRHLRDISDSMFGRICTVDTPDREGCGINQNLLVNTKLDDKLAFTEEKLEKAPISIPVSLVPFLEHDDQTRLQMASSQQRSAIMLKQFETPMIRSGCEDLYSNYTQFVKTAKKDGEVVHLDDKFLIVIYDDKSPEVFDVSYRKIYVENMNRMNIHVKPGDKFKAGDILAESNFCTNGGINIGRNLLTAVMIYYGYNYEDGIVLSDRLVNEGSFTSVHYRDLSFTIPPDRVLMSLSKDKYKPLPDLFETFSIGSPYAIMKKLPMGPSDFCTIFEEPNMSRTKKNIVITDVNIYPNIWNEEVPEYKEWVEKTIDAQKTKEKNLQKTISKYFPQKEAIEFIKDNANVFGHPTKFRIKGEKINGLYVEMFAIYTRKVEVGDKVGNRHGNKGAVSTIRPHEQMPQLADGRHVDICINPLGIISRMNIGQLFELHLAMALDDLKKNVYKMMTDCKSRDDEKIKEYILGFIKIIDNTKEGWYYKQFAEQLPKIITKEFVEKLSLIQPPFESVTAALTEEALEYTGTMFEQKLYDPVSKQHLLNPVAVGFMYFFRMVHIAETRLAARGFGSYAKRTLQPTSGRKHKGGQRCGEMETACLIAHMGLSNLFEMFTTKSDCIDLKNRYIRNQIDTDLIKEKEDDSVVPESVKLLESNMRAIGIEP